MLARESLSPMKGDSTKTSLCDNNDVGEQLEQYVVHDDEGYDDDDDDDDSEDQGTLFLGFLDDEPDIPSSHDDSFPSKAGGTPTWLDPIHLPSGRSFLCDFCEEPLQFVLQHRHEQQNHSHNRVTRSVKVFRCQLPLVNPFYRSDDQSSNGSSNHLGPKAALCSWCNTWKGDQICSGCRRVRYCSKKHQVMHWRSGHKDHCKQMIVSCNGESTSREPQRAASNTLWPEYEIIFELRHKSNTEVSEINGPLPLIQGMSETMVSKLDTFEGDDDKKCWASFQAHMAEGDDRFQVLRCWKEDGRPLWPESRGRPSADVIPGCSYCGGTMRFEFQIMPQLLSYFHVENEVDSLDWATIAIYTCEASCDSAHVYKEEFPWIQLYS